MSKYGVLMAFVQIGAAVGPFFPACLMLVLVVTALSGIYITIINWICFKSIPVLFWSILLVMPSLMMTSKVIFIF